MDFHSYRLYDSMWCLTECYTVSSPLHSLLHVSTSELVLLRYKPGPKATHAITAIFMKVSTLISSFIDVREPKISPAWTVRKLYGIKPADHKMWIRTTYFFLLRGVINRIQFTTDSATYRSLSLLQIDSQIIYIYIQKIIKTIKPWYLETSKIFILHLLSTSMKQHMNSMHMPLYSSTLVAC